ncbi:UNVERIFIED_CONTAM: hypothetical protein Slati_0780200 [Sesamum latifolium]|uniref:Uncharacterized protein n=1 Tax=Sesamum latifolium TaxID=2727402 RepID=A0AAW2XRI3_9LAMI
MAPSPTPSSSKKLLITEPKPKSVPPPNSASSSSTTATPPPEKRTRDQPNLSDCHCCGRRINHTNPRIDFSPWTVFGASSFSAGNVGRMFIPDRCAPIASRKREIQGIFFGLEGFRVCVDCWVPELLKNSIRGCGRSENKGGLKDRGEGRDLLEKVVKNAESDVERSVKMVANAKERTLRRVNGAKNAVDLANGVSDSLAKKDRDGLKAENSNCNGAIGVVDDAELAIHLHRAINSSPRILRSQMLGTCANDVEDERINQPVENASRVNVSRLNLGLLPYKRDRKRKIWWNGLSFKSSCKGKNHVECQMLGASANDVENEKINQPGENASRVNVNRLNIGLLPYKRDRKRIWQLDDQNTADAESRSSQPSRSKVQLTFRFGKQLVSYRRTRFRQKVCEVNGLGDISGECSSFDHHRMAFRSECSESDDAKLRTGSLGKSNTEVILPNGTCNLQRDRYHLKYGKRGTKSGSSLLHSGTFLSKNEVSAPALSNSETGNSAKCDGELMLPNGSSNQDPDRYCFKYSKRVKGSQSGSKSRTLSDVSFDSLTLDL